MDIPMVICKRRVINDCEVCGHITVLAHNAGDEVRLGNYTCQNCGHMFRVEVMPDGELGIIDQAANGR